MEDAQLYVGCRSKEIFMAKKELKVVSKVFIKKGETKTVTIAFDDKTFRYFNVKTKKWKVEEAEYDIMMGASSLDIKLKEYIFVEGTGVLLPYNKNILPWYYPAKANDMSLNEFENIILFKVQDLKWDRIKEIGYNDTSA